MKAVKPVAILLGIVVTFSLVGEAVIVVFQPTDIGIPVLVLTTTAEDGTANHRVLARMESNGELFVSANHWPRPWYHRALKNPKVQVTLDGKKADYIAVPVTEAERDRLLAESRFPFIARILTGFPPRQFLRLDLR